MRLRKAYPENPPSLVVGSVTIIKISVFFFLNMLDYGLTWYGLSTGVAREANPLFTSMSYEAMGLSKVAQGS